MIAPVPSLNFSLLVARMFNKKEATSFLQNSWGLQGVGEKLEASDCKNVLDEIVVLVQEKIPFQGITLMATGSDERSRPTVEEIKQDCMTGIGGLCYSINVFTWGLLKGLGFSVQLCKSTVTSAGTYPNNHVLVLVSNVKKVGDLYLVDCGSGFPTFRAIPLDFDQESPVYHDSFLDYKYVRHDGRVLRMHGKGDRVERNEPPVEGIDLFLGKWRRFYSFAPDPSECLADFDTAFDDVYTVPGTTPFHNSPRAIRFPEKRAVMSVNNRALVENEKGILVATIMESDEEIIKFFGNHFANIEPDTVRRAIREWRRVSV